MLDDIAILALRFLSMRRRNTIRRSRGDCLMAMYRMRGDVSDGRDTVDVMGISVAEAGVRMTMYSVV